MAGYEDTPGEVDGFELGFIEKAKPWYLVSHLFPNKVGGKPAWLALNNLPSNEELTCGCCQAPLSFLMQVYCPVDENPSCFHRTIFLFMCLNGKCYTSKNSSKPFAVFRCQLARKNDYYSFEPPPESKYSCTLSAFKEAVKKDLIPHASKHISLCKICGCPGSKSCSKCKLVSYCSKDHQLIDWKTGHKSLCPNLLSGTSTLPNPIFDFEYSSALLPEFELVMGPDPHGSRSPSPCDENGQNNNLILPRSSSPVCPTEQELNNLEEIMQKYNHDSTDETESKEINGLEEVAKKETPRDKMFMKFKKAISSEPDQVLRYHRDGSPLWIAPFDDDLDSTEDANRNTPSRVPACGNCGAPRMFEFQVTPQLLHYLKLESLASTPSDPVPDFGCLYVFSCSAHCNPECNADGKIKKEYLAEYLIRQDIC